MIDPNNTEEIERYVNKYMTLIETELGEDVVPIIIILLCRMTIKYNLDIAWVISTIFMGYYNELPPDITNDKGEVKFDS